MRTTNVCLTLFLLIASSVAGQADDVSTCGSKAAKDCGSPSRGGISAVAARAEIVGKAKTSNLFAGRAIHEVCHSALTADRRGWDTSFGPMVAEAERRGLTIEACRKALVAHAASVATAHAPLDLPNVSSPAPRAVEEICHSALTADRRGWDASFGPIVTEAQRRGLSISSCRAVLAGADRPGVAPADASATQPKAAASPAAAATLGKRVALVIGNSAYRSVAHLPNAGNDADLTAAVLRKVGFADVTVAKDLDRAGMIAALQEFGTKADSADWAVVYYAGHGIEVGGRNFLIPVDAQLKRERHVEDEAIALDRVMTSTEGAKTIRLIALDACRDNPFEGRMKAANGVRSIGRGLARVEPDGATLVLFAAKEGTTAADGTGSNSPFAAAFANRIVEPGVEINFVIRRLQNDVVSATGSAQQPVMYGTMPLQELYFIPPG